MWRLPSPASLLKQDAQDYIHGSFWISPSMELYNLYGCFVPVTLPVKRHFLIVRGSLLCFGLCPLPLVPSLGKGKNLASSPAHSPFRCLCTLIGSLPKHSLLKAEQSQLSLFPQRSLQSLNYHSGPLLTLCSSSVSSWKPRSGATLGMCLSGAEGEDALPQPAGSALPHPALDAICFPVHTAGSHSACCPPGPPGSSQKAVLQTILGQGFVPQHVQDFGFAFGELYEGPVWQFLQGSLWMEQSSVRSGIPPSHLSFLKRCKSRCHLMASTVFMIYAATDKRIPSLWNSFVNVQMSFDSHLKGNQFKAKRPQDNFPLKIMCPRTKVLSACNHF